ncbi:MAG: Txe/YoeB family addiction module toxin [Alkalispirochaetaceae bacterium]
MRYVFTQQAWDDYQHWVKSDKRVLRRLNELIKATARDPFEGIGKPEPLRHQLQGYWSRRISDEHRFVYTVSGDDLIIVACRFHY